LRFSEKPMRKQEAGSPDRIDIPSDDPVPASACQRAQSGKLYRFPRDQTPRTPPDIDGRDCSPLQAMIAKTW